MTIALLPFISYINHSCNLTYLRIVWHDKLYVLNLDVAICDIIQMVNPNR